MVWAASILNTTIGKKVVMAITGVIMFGFLIGHMAGNLQLFLGEEKFDGYAAFLKGTPALLWGTRLVLLASIVLHVWAALSLTARNRASRPVRYGMYRPMVSGPPSRTMMLSGVIVLAFLIYHLLHFTFGMVHPDFEHIRAYRNVLVAFSKWWVVLIYVLAMLLLAFHLKHGVWSLFQTLGLNHPKWNRLRRVLATLIMILICGGFVLVPLGVMMHLAKDPVAAGAYVTPNASH
jgi:succinate dehydrogenase / fumarate reductase, cytochrome b subunit